MSDKKWYLKEDVYFEPLFNHWYAWPYLISPATAARHTVNTHRRIMKSFVNNYHLHIMANQEKDLAGSEYLNANEDQLPQIRDLIKELDTECADLVALSNAITDLDELLRGHTSGESIEPLYDKVPEPLQGLVELYLDTEHRPGYRFIEPLMYKSELYRSDLQTLCFGLLSEVDERPFVFSTPRLVDDKHIELKLTYNDPRTNQILKARDMPLSDAELDALVDGVEAKGGLALRDLFTQNAPVLTHEKVEEGVRVNYLGHAGFMLETADVSIVIDPVVPSRDKPDNDELISFSELPESIDYLCVTHSHQDHVNIETLLQLRHKTKTILAPKNNGGSIVDPSIKLMMEAIGISTVEMEDLEEIAIPGGKIVAIPFLGEHGDLNIRSKAAWYVELLGRKFFFGADSSNLDHRMYTRLGKLFNDLDILAMGMECVGAPFTWLYGALFTKPVPKNIKSSRRLNGSDYEKAHPIAEVFNPDQVFIYALGKEPWYKYFTGLEYHDDSKQLLESNKMVEHCEKSGTPAESLYAKRVVHLPAK